MRRRRVGLLAATIASSVTCTNPIDAPAIPGSGLLQLTGPPTIIVNQTSLLAVIEKDSHGRVIIPAGSGNFVSSDPSVATVSKDGVVRGAARGTATISVNLDGLAAQLPIAVKARVILTSANLPTHDPQWFLTTGDRMRLTAEFTDVNGVPIAAAPTLSWQSSNTEGVSVDSTGFVIAQKQGQATITASTADGNPYAQFFVNDAVPGSTATVRFAHVAQGIGPITFRSNKLAPVTLAYGQSVDLPAGAGTLDVETIGLPHGPYGETSLSRKLDSGASLSLYAVMGSPTWGTLSAAWGTTDPIPPDSGLVRLVQGAGFALPIVYLRPAGAPRSGIPQQCYFDPVDATNYYVQPGGAFDLILQEKPAYYFDSTAAFVRVAASVTPGHAITLVLTGNGLSTAGYRRFDDR